jgi:anti-anti-sigma factor
MLMEISHSQIAPGTAVVKLSGKVMMGQESEQIVNLVEQLLSAGTKTIIFDMAGVSHIDSTGVGRFISSYNKAASAGGEVRMAAATGHLFQVFHVSLLDTVFRFFPTVEEARTA